MVLVTCTPQATGQENWELSGYTQTPKGLGMEMTRLMWPQLTPSKMAPRTSMSDTLPPTAYPISQTKKQRLSSTQQPARVPVQRTRLDTASLKEVQAATSTLDSAWILLCVHVVCVFVYVFIDALGHPSPKPSCPDTSMGSEI